MYFVPDRLSCKRGTKLATAQLSVSSIELVGPWDISYHSIRSIVLYVGRLLNLIELKINLT